MLRLDRLRTALAVYSLTVMFASFVFMAVVFAVLLASGERTILFRPNAYNEFWLEAVMYTLALAGMPALGHEIRERINRPNA